MNECFVSSGISGKRKERIRRDVITYSIERGLGADEVRRSALKYGKNTLEKKGRTSLTRRFLSNFGDPIIRILLAACAVNILLNLRDINWIEIGGILAAVFVSTFISAVFEHSASGAFERLNARSEEYFGVVREGRLVRCAQGDIVVGDIVKICGGEIVPCDGIMIAGTVKCDQSVLTGESRHIDKKSRARGAGSFAPDTFTGNPEKDDEVFSGCGIISGEGFMLCIKVGESTYFGSVAAKVQSDKTESPLKNRLGELAKKISFIGYIAAFLVAGAYLFNSFFIDSGMSLSVMLARLSDARFTAGECLSALTLAISVLVVAVPEGLPMMITVVLSSNMNRMIKKNVLVRRMVGIETSGNLGILFCDKTGTLTEGKMSLSRIITPDGEYPSGNAFVRDGEMLGCILSPAPSSGRNQTDTAFCAFADSMTPPETFAKVPFESSRRCSAAGIRISGESVTVVRGAPEILLGHVSRIRRGGKRSAMTPADISRIRDLVSSLSASGRVIMLCSAPGDMCAHIMKGEFPDLTFLGIAEICDGVRKDAQSSVRDAQKAGIQVVMMTGDGAQTAAAVAGKCGILTEGGVCISGDVLRAMSDGEVTELIPRLNVVSRALPSDKLRLVELAKSAGLVAGMTGDGVNDAPSLCAADVGFAMGSGSEVASAASDIVILDSSLRSIVNAVLFGRTIFKSIRKFITFQLIMNLCATAVSFIGPFIGIDAPVTVVQMLWINMIMDTLGALAFAGEAPNPRCLREAPVPRSQGLITPPMLARILLSSSFMTAVCLMFLKLLAFRSLFPDVSDLYYLTVFFVIIIFMGIFTSFCVRTDRINLLSGISKNPAFVLIMALASAVQFALVEFGGSAIRCIPLSSRDAALAVLIAASVIPIQSTVKLFFRK